jgi:hypothetical protein
LVELMTRAVRLFITARPTLKKRERWFFPAHAVRTYSLWI